MTRELSANFTNEVTEERRRVTTDGEWVESNPENSITLGRFDKVDQLDDAMARKFNCL